MKGIKYMRICPSIVLAFLLVAFIMANIGCNIEMTPTEPTANVESILGTMPGTIEVALGETFIVSLVSNPSTGYSWQPEFDPNFLELVDSRFVPASTEAAGVPGVEIFEFRALKEGQVELTMRYKRPWEEESIDERTSIVNIVSPGSETVTVNQGETFTISLVSNPTTGYMWQPEFDPQFLELVSSQFVSDSTLVGSPGVQTFEFRALKEGQVELRMIYKRPWEPEPIDERTILVEILPASD